MKNMGLSSVDPASLIKTQFLSKKNPATKFRWLPVPGSPTPAANSQYFLVLDGSHGSRAASSHPDKPHRGCIPFRSNIEPNPHALAEAESPS